MINKELLEEHSYNGEGFKPLVVYKTWRVAFLNYINELESENISRVERHPETDEVFVLMRGGGVLFIGEGEPEVKRLFPQIMEQGVIYNVKPLTWHTIVLTRDATVLIVENSDTSEKNSQYSDLSTELKEFIQNNGLT
jgi:ureidoglycolate hydrolase